MHRTIGLLLAIISVASAPGLAETGASPNLIANGGFEEPDPQDAARPRGWTPQVDGRIEVAWADGQARSGRRSLGMFAYPEEKNAHASWTSDPIAVKPGMAYRMSFSYLAEGHGVPVFQLLGVKQWRLEAGHTAGKWVEHEDVVVIPAKATSVKFVVNNYHRPGKKLWLDDVSLVELPLTESPLTRRTNEARAAIKALTARVEALTLSTEQRRDMAELTKNLAQVEQDYAAIAAGRMDDAGLTRLLAALDDLESRLAAYRSAVWIIRPEAWQKGDRQPAGLTPEARYDFVAPGRSGTVTCYMGLASLIHVGLPGAISVSLPRSAKDWKAELWVTPAGEPQRPSSGELWGRTNCFGEVFLPPGMPRFVRLDLKIADTKPGMHDVTLRIACLDRPQDGHTVTLRVKVP